MIDLRSKRVVFVLLALLAASCSSDSPALVRSGYLDAGSSIAVHNQLGNIDAYAPRNGQAANQYTIEGYGRDAPHGTSITFHPRAVAANALLPGIMYLVRAPKDSRLHLSTIVGNINVQDVDGIVDARASRGNITMFLPQYGNAFIGNGNLQVSFGSTSWPGTVHFVVENGDVEVHVKTIAQTRVHLHTDRGTIYSDFPLRGTSAGTSETIDSMLNGGGKRSIDIEVRNGSIRLLEMKPQV